MINLKNLSNVIILLKKTELKNSPEKLLSSSKLQIIEEVFFLCTRKDFNKDIDTIREFIGKTDVEYLSKSIDILGEKVFLHFDNNLVKTYLPIKIDLVDHDFDESLDHYRKLGEDFFNKYIKKVDKLLKKYKLLKSIYYPKNHLVTVLENKGVIIEEDELVDNTILWDAAIERLEEEEFFSYKELNLIDLLIFFNDPCPSGLHEDWANDLSTKKNEIVFSISENSIWALRDASLDISFPAYFTVNEMCQALKKDSEKISEHISNKLPLQNKKYTNKSNISKWIDVYTMHKDGLKKEKIAYKLDKKYGGDHSIDQVSKLIQRTKNESDRFTDKQE